MGQSQAQVKYLPGSKKTKISNIKIMSTGYDFPSTKKMVISHDQTKVLLDYGVNETIHEQAKRQTFQLWDIQKRKCLSKFKIKYKFLSEIALFPDGSKLVAVFSYNNIGIYDSMNGKKLKRIEQIADIYALQVASVGNYIFSGHSNVIKKWDIQQSTCIQRFEVDQKVILLKLSSNNKLLASQDASFQVKVWKVDTGECGIVLNFYDKIQAEVIKLYDDQIIIGCLNGDIKIFDSNTFNLLFTLKSHQGKILYLEMVSKEGILVSQGEKGVFSIWNVKSQKCLANRKLQEGRHLCMESQQIQNLFFERGDFGDIILLRKVQHPRPIIELSISDWATQFSLLKNQIILKNKKKIGFIDIEN